MSIAIGSSRESNLLRRICHLRAVPLGHVADVFELLLLLSDLKEVLRRQELKDEIIQPSKSEELARELVEPNVKLVDGRYEIPVPLKSDIVNNLTNNFHSAVDRTAPLRKKALKDSGLKPILADTFHELIDKGSLVPVVDSDFDHDKCWSGPVLGQFDRLDQIGPRTLRGLALAGVPFCAVRYKIGESAKS